LTTEHIDTAHHPISDSDYVDRCRHQLDGAGALVLAGFFTPTAIRHVVAESAHRESEAFYTRSTHNVYLTPPDPTLPPDHSFNRQVASSKGLLADDQVPQSSPLRSVYQDDSFRAFLRGVLGVDELHPYADRLSSINVHFASAGQELGWHFDNSSFAVTMLLQAPESGGVFEYVRDARDAAGGDMGFDRVAAVLDGAERVERLDIAAGDLVLFRGRDALHRVTPTDGSVTRMLVVFAFNAEPGVELSQSALTTFYGRTA
jgi:hypothetical protein